MIFFAKCDEFAIDITSKQEDKIILSVGRKYPKAHFHKKTQDNLIFLDGKNVIKINKRVNRASKELNVIRLAMSKRVNVPISYIDYLDSNREVLVQEYVENDYNIYHSPESLVKELIKLHSIKQYRFNKMCYGQEYSSWYSFITFNLREHLKELELSNELKWDILSIFEKSRGRLDNNHSMSLLHGDLTPSNMIFNNDKTYLIDFEESCVGDPLYDVAFFDTSIYRPFSLYPLYAADNTREERFRYLLYCLRISIVKYIVHKNHGINDTSNRVVTFLEKIKNYED